MLNLSLKGECNNLRYSSIIFPGVINFRNKKI